ncbi:MAG: tetratricopeptide repeat protein, partial [Gemmatimonadota bacterium]
RAIELSPSNSNAERVLAYLTSLRGPGSEVEFHLERARELDPLSTGLLEWLARVEMGLNRFDRVQDLARQVLEINPAHALGFRWLGDALLTQGNATEALKTFESGLKVDSSYTRLLNGKARALAALGRPAEARAIAARLGREATSRYVRAEEIAGIYAALGDRDRAFHWLDRAYQDRSAGMNWLQHYPMYDPLRSDPRFTELLRKANLPVPSKLR